MVFAKVESNGTITCGMTRWDGQPGNPACRLLSKHGVFLCSAILQECQTRQMPGVS